MSVQRAIRMIAAAAMAYYFGYGAIAFLEALGGAIGGMAGVPSRGYFDPAIDAWWQARQSAIVSGFVSAAVVTALQLWIARRRGDRNWLPSVALVTLVVGAQPLLQFTLLQRSMVNRFNRGDASAAAAMPNLGLNAQLPAVIARLRTGGPDSFQLAQSAMNFSGGPGEVRLVALDHSAPRAARFSAALAAGSHGPKDDAEVLAVLDEVVRDADTDFRASVPGRLRSAQFYIAPERARAIQAPLLLDASPRVRLAALGGDEFPAGCDLLPKLVGGDPVREIQLRAFVNLGKCHWGEPKSEDVRSERIAIYRPFLKHPELEIRIRAGNVLAWLGDASGTDAALQFVKGDPYGKDAEILVLAMSTLERNLGGASMPMMWTIWQCDRAVIRRGHYYQSRNAASDALDRYYGYGKWPSHYQYKSTAPATPLPEFCVTSD